MSVFLLVLGLFLFIMLVVVHELGHFLVARRNGVEAEEFGIFFPPKIWSRKTKKGWLFSINALPLGGFVRLKGEHDEDKGKGTYGAARLWVKVKILLAGVGMNLVAAFVLLMILAWAGLPQLVNNQFLIKSDSHEIRRATSSVVASGIESNSPASAIGLKSNDKLLAIGPSGHLQNLSSANQVPKLTASLAGQTVEVVFRHNNQIETKSTTLRSSAVVAAAKKAGKQEGYLGVAVNQLQSGLTLTRSTWSAPIVAGGLMVQFTALTFHGLGAALHGLGSTIAGLVSGNSTARQAGQSQASNQIAGPVGVFDILKTGSTLGYQFILMVVAIISLSLAIMNVLPIPALDGGKLFVTLITRLLHVRLTAKIENWVYGAGFAFLLVLVVLITIADVHRFS